MIKNLYAVYFESQAGGGYFSDVFVTSTYNDLQNFVTHILYNPHLVFKYGLDMEVVAYSNAIVEDNCIQANDKTKIKSIENILSKTKIILKDFPDFKYDEEDWIFIPKKELSLPNQQWLNTIIEGKDKEECIKMMKDNMEVKIDWAKLNLPLFTQDFILPTESFENDLLNDGDCVKLGFCSDAVDVPISDIMGYVNEFLKQINKLITL